MVAASSPEFEAWAQAHKVSVETAGRYAMFDIPNKVLQLAMAGDRRGIPLLRQALLSRNFLIVTWGAKGLAQLQDEESIPLIIAAARRAPPGTSSVIVEPLVYFDDPQAQGAVDTYFTKEEAKLNRGARAQGRGFSAGSKSAPSGHRPRHQRCSRSTVDEI